MGNIADFAKHSLQRRVLLPKHGLQENHLLRVEVLDRSHIHHIVPPPRLEAEDHSAVSQPHGRQLEEVPFPSFPPDCITARDDLDASEGKRVVADCPADELQHVKQSSVQHRYLVDDQHLARLPSLHRRLVLSYLPQRLVHVQIRDAQAGEGVDRDAADVARRDARRRRHEHLVFAQLLLERLDRDSEKIALSRPRVAGEEHVLSLRMHHSDAHIPSARLQTRSSALEIDPIHTRRQNPRCLYH